MEMSFGMKNRKTTLIYMMIWMIGAVQETNYRGKTLRKVWMITRIVAVLAGTRVRRLHPMKDESMSNYF